MCVFENCTFSHRLHQKVSLSHAGVIVSKLNEKPESNVRLCFQGPSLKNYGSNYALLYKGCALFNQNCLYIVQVQNEHREISSVCMQKVNESDHSFRLINRHSTKLNFDVTFIKYKIVCSKRSFQ